MTPLDVLTMDLEAWSIIGFKMVSASSCHIVATVKRKEENEIGNDFNRWVRYCTLDYLRHACGNEEQQA